jgi:Zn finger protein HypA/HybF involved in hydrogenase expression
MTEIRPLNRTLDQELQALTRAASLECLVCGEFVLHRHGEIECPECGLRIHDLNSGQPGLQLGLQAG